MKSASKHLQTAEGKLTQAAAMRGRLLKGVGIVKPRKRAAHFVWHRYNKDEADSAIRQHREDLKAQSLRLAKGKERMATSDVTSSAENSSAGPSMSSDVGDATKDADEEGGEKEQKVEYKSRRPPDTSYVLFLTSPS